LFSDLSPSDIERIDPMIKKILLSEDEIDKREEWKNGSLLIDWISNPRAGVIIENQRLGVRLKHFAVIGESGEYLYDTFGIEELPGNSVCVVVDQLERIGLLREYRMMPEREFWACPRGFSNDAAEERIATARREAVEELGLEDDQVLNDVRVLGQLFQNTTFFIMPVGVVLIKIINTPSQSTAVTTQEHEDIRQVQFFDLKTVRQMIANGEIDCGLTLGALMLYFSKLKSFP
jgi:ADP-ribose pyrophosphatase YjhB (NUDIX family)